MNRHEPENDLEELEREILLNPDDLRLRFKLGCCYCARMDFRKALPQLLEAENLPETRAEAIECAAICFEQMGMLDLAIHHRRKGNGGQPPEGSGKQAPIVPVEPDSLHAVKRVLPSSRNID